MDTLILTIGRETFPVEYMIDGDNLLIIASSGELWWQALRGGAVISLYLDAAELLGYAEVYENPNRVYHGLVRLMQVAPFCGWRFGLELDEHGHPVDPFAVDELARESVIVRIMDIVPAGVPA